jgi:hypothetical protein
VQKIEMINDCENKIGKTVATSVSDKGKTCLEKPNFVKVRILMMGFYCMNAW